MISFSWEGVPAAPWWFFAGMGALFILSGIMVVIFPQILVLLFASVLLSVGIYFLRIGLTLRPVGGSVHRRQVRVPGGCERFGFPFGGQGGWPR